MYALNEPPADLAFEEVGVEEPFDFFEWLLVLRIIVNRYYFMI